MAKKMNQVQRDAVSKRMKKYWSKRRREKKNGTAVAAKPRRVARNGHTDAGIVTLLIDVPRDWVPMLIHSLPNGTNVRKYA